MFRLICLQKSISKAVHVRCFVLSLVLKRHFSAPKFTKVPPSSAERPFLLPLVSIFVERFNRKLPFHIRQLITYPIFLLYLVLIGQMWLPCSQRPHHYEPSDVQIDFVNTITVFEPVKAKAVRRVLHGCALKRFLDLALVRENCDISGARKATFFEIVFNVTVTKADLSTLLILQMLQHI